MNLKKAKRLRIQIDDIVYPDTNLKRPFRVTGFWKELLLMGEPPSGTIHTGLSLICVQALDNPECKAAWPREWIVCQGEQLEIF